MNMREFWQCLKYLGMAYLVGMPVILVVGFIVYVLLCVSVGCLE